MFVQLVSEDPIKNDLIYMKVNIAPNKLYNKDAI